MLFVFLDESSLGQPSFLDFPLFIGCLLLALSLLIGSLLFLNLFLVVTSPLFIQFSLSLRVLFCISFFSLSSNIHNLTERKYTGI